MAHDLDYAANNSLQGYLDSGPNQPTEFKIFTKTTSFYPLTKIKPLILNYLYRASSRFPLLPFLSFLPPLLHPAVQQSGIQPALPLSPLLHELLRHLLHRKGFTFTSCSGCILFKKRRSSDTNYFPSSPPSPVASFSYSHLLPLSTPPPIVNHHHHHLLPLLHHYSSILAGGTDTRANMTATSFQQSHSPIYGQGNQPLTMVEELVIASSSIDGGIGCWDLQTGAEQLRYKSCASSPHGLTPVGHCFLASSQLCDSKASCGFILYWSWTKPQVEVKSFPEEPIKPLVANSEGTYIAGGGQSGCIYLWEVVTGRLLKKWRAHYRAVTCLTFSEDDSILVSGSEDGAVTVWSLLMMFDDYQNQQASHRYEHNFQEHTLRVTDLVTGHGGGNAIIISASEDRTCKVWSLSKEKLMRNIVFPSVIDAIVLDPWEHVFYAGGRDGKIYIASLTGHGSSYKNQFPHIVGSLCSQSKAVTCLAFSERDLLLAGSEDGMIRVWDPKTCNIVCMFKLGKGPVNNVLVVRRPVYLTGFNVQPSLRRHGSSLFPPPLRKYMNSTEEDAGKDAVVALRAASDYSLDAAYLSSQVIGTQIKQLQVLNNLNKLL